MSPQQYPSAEGAPTPWQLLTDLARSTRRKVGNICEYCPKGDRGSREKRLEVHVGVGVLREVVTRPFIIFRIDGVAKDAVGLHATSHFHRCRSRTRNDEINLTTHMWKPRRRGWDGDWTMQRPSLGVWFSPSLP